MKTIFSIIIVLTFCVVSFSQNDTINRVDVNNNKQGFWKLYFEGTEKVLEQGYFVDDMRTGVWTQFLDDGAISSEITYVDDEPNGYAKIYHANGKIAEEGVWQNDVWVGEYKAYHNNGQLVYKWNFNEEGLRTGHQEYYHDNGIVMISGNWENGNETGVVTRYDERGVLVLEQTYENGVINPELTVEYKDETDKKPVATEEKLEVIESNTQLVSALKKDTIASKKLEMFDGTGEQKLYDSKRRLKQDGYFENGKLIKGKKYFYNSKGEIIKIEIYNNGKLFKTDYPDKKDE